MSKKNPGHNVSHLAIREFLEKVLEPIRTRVGAERFDPDYGKDLLSNGTDEDGDPLEDVVEELSRKASIGR